MNKKYLLKYIWIIVITITNALHLCKMLGL